MGPRAHLGAAVPPVGTHHEAGAVVALERRAEGAHSELVELVLGRQLRRLADRRRALVLTGE